MVHMRKEGYHPCTTAKTTRLTHLTVIVFAVELQLATLHGFYSVLLVYIRRQFEIPEGEGKTPEGVLRTPAPSHSRFVCPTSPGHLSLHLSCHKTVASLELYGCHSRLILQQRGVIYDIY